MVATAVKAVFDRYVAQYGTELQGCCPLIADEIQKAVGGEVVGGYLTWYSGSCRRMHWWVVKGDVVLDPMGDHLLSFEQFPGRIEAHRDRAIFLSILPRFEQWRVPA